MSNTPREQLSETESQVNTRQDRNMQILDGGNISWDSPGGNLTWDAAVTVAVGGVAVATVAASTAVGMTAAGDCLYVDISRTAGGGVLAAGTGTVADAGHATDARVVLGVRGTDGRFYWRNGTVMADGDYKTFGSLKSSTDRTDVLADGLALQSVGFTYLLGANQLAVYVGGFLLSESVHYTETSDTQITFSAGNVPAPGEDITFLNVLGGQGPAGSTLVSMQDAYSVGNTVAAATGSALHLWNADASDVPVLSLGVDALLTNAGLELTNRGAVRLTGPSREYEVLDGAGVDSWHIVPLDDGSGDLVVFNDATGKGMILDKGGQGIGFGAYAGAYPGGAWAGDEPVRWSVYHTVAQSAAWTINTGLATILGVLVNVGDSTAPGNAIAFELNGYANPSKRLVVEVTKATGVITITGNAGSLTSVGPDLVGEAIDIVVFHQG